MKHLIDEEEKISAGQPKKILLYTYKIYFTVIAGLYSIFLVFFNILEKYVKASKGYKFLNHCRLVKHLRSVFICLKEYLKVSKGY